MADDITKYAEQVISKITGNNEMISKFKSDPTKTRSEEHTSELQSRT